MGHFRFCRCQYHHMHHASRAHTSQGAKNITVVSYGPGARLTDDVPGHMKPQGLLSGRSRTKNTRRRVSARRTTTAKGASRDGLLGVLLPRRSLLSI